MNAAAARTPLAFVAVAALFAGALASAPTNARASSGTDAVVAQLDQFNAAQLIDSYKVKYAVDGDNVAVAAVLTGMPGPNSLDIPAGVHVDWNLAAGASGLVFTGGGSVTFKANNYTGPKAGAAFVDSTGVSLKFDGWNISCGSSAAGTTAVKATGANVEWAAGTATCYDGIVVTGGNAVVSGGTISAKGTAVKVSGGTATVSGGEMNATGANDSATVRGDGAVSVTGGTLTAKGDYASVLAGSPAGVVASGGTLQVSGAYGKVFDRGPASNPKLVVNGNTTVRTKAGDASLPDIDMASGLLYDTASYTVYGTYTMAQDIQTDSDQSFTINPGATLTVPVGVQLTIEGPFANNGTLIVAGAVKLSGQDANNGAITVAAGGTLVNNDPLANNGAITIAGAAKNYGVIANAGTIDVAAGGSLYNSGTIDGGGTVTVWGELAGTGTTKGAVVTVNGQQTYPYPVAITPTLKIATPGGDTPTKGTKLSITGVPAGWTAAYQWLRDGKAIGQATKATRVVAKADLGHKLSATVTLSKPDYAAKAFATTALSISKTAVAFTPKVKGTAKQGKTLKASGAPKGWKAKYQWLRDGKAIKKATKSSRKLAKADVGHKLSVRVTVTKKGKTKTVKTSQATKAVKAKAAKS